MRKRLYNPDVDPDVPFEPRPKVDGQYEAGPLFEPSEAHPANVISSRDGTDGLHYPVLDIDFPARLIESKTPGHFHLYLDGLGIPWIKYAPLLEALADAGVIEQGYAEASVLRGQSLVRIPPGDES